MERAATGPGHRAHANLYWTYHTRAGADGRDGRAKDVDFGGASRPGMKVQPPLPCSCAGGVPRLSPDERSRKTQALRSASIVAVGTIPSTRRASSASRVTNASACS